MLVAETKEKGGGGSWILLHKGFMAQLLTRYELFMSCSAVCNVHTQCCRALENSTLVLVYSPQFRKKKKGD